MPKTTSGRVFEGMFKFLKPAGFSLVNWEDLAKKKLFESDRKLVENYPYTTIYGTRGRHEWLVIDGERRLLVECKFQDFGGSTDEKAPYILRTWRYPEPFIDPKNRGPFPLPSNWLVAFAGTFFETKDRGIKSIDWLQKHADKYRSKTRSLDVTRNVDELADYLDRWINDLST